MFPFCLSESFSCPNFPRKSNYYYVFRNLHLIKIKPYLPLENTFQENILVLAGSQTRGYRRFRDLVFRSGIVLVLIVLGLTPEWIVASEDNSQLSAYEKGGTEFTSAPLSLSSFQPHVFTASLHWLLCCLTWQGDESDH